MDKTQFLAKIPNIEKMYLLVSTVTQLPYVETAEETFDDMVFLYDTEENARTSAANYAAKKIPLKIVLVKKEQMLQMFTSLFALGVNAFQAEIDGETQINQLKNLIKKPDVSNVPKEKRPIENPELQLSMIYYMQAVRTGTKMDDPEYRELEEEMIVNFTRGTYYLPFIKNTVDGKEVVQTACVKMKNGTQMIPLFTDRQELLKFAGKRKVEVTVIKFDKLVDTSIPEEVEGFVINPNSIATPLPKTFIENIKTSIAAFQKN